MRQEFSSDASSAGSTKQHLAACLKFRLKVTASAEVSWLFLFMFVSVKPKPFDARSPQFRLFCTTSEAVQDLRLSLQDSLEVDGCNASG